MITIDENRLIGKGSHGDIETNRGIGSVFDLIVDRDGAVSKTLGVHSGSNEVTEKYYDGLANSLVARKEYLLENRIITKTPEHRNIACQRNESGRFTCFVIDSVVNTDYIQICHFADFLAKKKIARRWQRFERNRLAAYPHNKALGRMLA